MKEYKSFTTYTKTQGLSTNAVRDITEDKNGNLWFNTIGGGISRLDKDHKYFTNYTTAQGLANNYSWPMIEDKNGNLWIGTQVGLSRFDGTSFTNYTKADGMADHDVGDLIMNKDGVIWLGSYKGFTALKGFARDEQLQDSSYTPSLKPSNELSNADLKKGRYKPVFEIYSNKTGYPGKEINNIGVTHEGAIWAGTGGFLGDKLIRFDFSDILINPNPPNVIIQGIKINNETISWYDLFFPADEQNSKIATEMIGNIAIAPNITDEGIALGKILSDEQRTIMQKKFNDIKFDSITPFYPLPVDLVLPYQHNSLSFDFAAIEPARSFLVRYQYMLEGYDKEWNPVTDQTTASFGNMREGSYTFKVKAQSPDGVWSRPAIYSFKVLPPWHRTWWSYTLYVLAFLIALWIFIKWRVKKLKAEKIILEEKVVKRSHELKEEKEKVETALTDLKTMQAQLIQSEKMASLGELTAGIAHEIQNPLNFVNNFSEVSEELVVEAEGSRREAGENSPVVTELLTDIKQNMEKINHHGKRADAIVKGMLQHSQTTTGNRELTDINQLIDEYIKLAFHAFRGKDPQDSANNTFNVKLQTDFDPSIEEIEVAPQEIGRVLLNVLNNAFYAVNDRKKNDPGFSPEVIVQTKKVPKGIEISVKDNGAGIPANIVGKIFQPFFTTKPTGQGTGLGLSLAYDIVKAHGGELKVETFSTEAAAQKGTRFIILLPDSR